MANAANNHPIIEKNLIKVHSVFVHSFRHLFFFLTHLLHTYTRVNVTATTTSRERRKLPSLQYKLCLHTLTQIAFKYKNNKNETELDLKYIMFLILSDGKLIQKE